MRYSRGERAGCLAALIPIIIVILLIIGYIQCVVKAIDSDWEPVGKREISYSIGVGVPPLGGIIGWFDIKDKPYEIQK